MATISVNGVELYYTQTGKGAPLLFLHGNGEDHTTFTPLIAELSRDFTCYAIDSRNHGKSAAHPDYHYDAMMKDIHAFITALNLAPVRIVGFSDGSIITMLLAMKYPQLAERIVLLGPNLSPNDFTPACTRYVERLYRLDPNPLYKMMLEEPNILPEDLHAISAKTLIMGGENDVYIEGTFETIAHNIEAAQLFLLKDHDHSSYIVQNDLIYAWLYDFLK